MRAVNPLMGADLIIVVFAVVVIGGLGSIFGSVAAGFGIGLLQAWGEAYGPAAAGADPGLRRDGRRAAVAPGRPVRP